MTRKKRPLEDLVAPLVQRLSSFEAILVEVIICLIIFISVLTPKVAQASTPGRSSLLVNWNKPYAAYVTATYTNGANTNVTCTSTGTSCTIGPIYGNPGTINYVVHEVNTGYPIKDGSKSTYLSGGLAYASISWTWSYELQVYPFAFGDCARAGSECKVRPFATNVSSFNEAFNDLLPNTTYQTIVCLTACTYYAPQLKKYTEVTGTPANALNVSYPSATCNAYGLVNADFTWNRATGRDYDVQFLDKSTDAAWPNGVNVPFGADPQKLSVTDLYPNQLYYFRINSKIAGTGTPGIWDTSYTKSFIVPNCTVPKPVTAKAILTSPVAANPVGMSCPAGSTGVTVNFKWQAPIISGGTWDNPIYLDYSKSNNNFADGTFTGIPVAPTSTTYGQTNFAGDTTYYWRINAKVAGSSPAQWVTSDVGQFTTPDCSTSLPIVTAKAVLVSPIATNPTGMVCSATSGVVVNFKWQAATISGGTYDYAYIDYSVYNDNFALPYKNSVRPSNATIFGGSGFASGISYFWRVNYHVAKSSPAQWVTSDTGSFTTPTCSSTPLGGGCTFTNVANQKQKYGDVNNDGRITTGDATLVKRYVAGVDEQLMGDKTAADVDGINGVNNTDADLILQFYFGTRSTFPVCSTGSTAPLSCGRVDVSDNGAVNSGDGTFIRRNYSPPGVYNAKYDLNNDNVVDDLDLRIVYESAYYGKYCKALLLTPLSVCSSLGSGNIVDVTFKWIAANGDPGIKTQWVDYDTSDHGTGGGWPASNAKNYAPGVSTSGIIHGFEQGKGYFWRVNTQLADGSWVSSASRPFVTPDCTPVPSNLLATPSTAEKLSDGTPCASAPYSVAFGWSNPNKGVGWYIDVTSTAGFPPGSVSNKLIDGNTVLLTTGADLNVPIQFKPGLTYYWRIFNGVKAYDGNSFSIAACAQSFGLLNYYIKYGDRSIVAADMTALKDRIRSTWPNSSIDQICEGSLGCLDYAILQSQTRGISPAFMLTVWEEEGAYGGVPSSDEFGMVHACTQHDTKSSIDCFLNYSGASPTITPSYLASGVNPSPYDPSNPAASYVAWMNAMCGTTNANFCYNNPNFITNMPIIYDRIAGPGKRVIF